MMTKQAVVDEPLPSIENENNTEENQSIWASILHDVKSSTKKAPATKSLIVLGDNESGRTTLVARLQGNDDPKRGAGLEYHYIDVKDDDRDDTPKLGVWILDGDIACSGPLLKFAIKSETLENSIIILVANMTQPWALLSTLKKWIEFVEEHIDRLKIDPIRLREMRDRLQYDFQHYIEPNDSSSMLISSSSSTTIKSGGRVPNSISSVSLASTTPLTPTNGDEQIVLPLADGVLTKSLGVPIIVVITKCDVMSTLEKENDYKDEQFDFMQHHLRKFCLEYGAALFYTSVKEKKNIDKLYKYIVHKCYGYPFTSTAAVVERDAIFIPMGWDNPKKADILLENLHRLKPTDNYSDVFVKPVVRRPLQRDSEIIAAEDDQEFLARLQLTLNRAASPGRTEENPTPVRTSGVSGGSQTPSAASRSRTQQNVTPTATNTAANEGALANFFNSLLTRKSGGAATPTTAGTPVIQRQTTGNQSPTTPSSKRLQQHPLTFAAPPPPGRIKTPTSHRALSPSLNAYSSPKSLSPVVEQQTKLETVSPIITQIPLEANESVITEAKQSDDALLLDKEPIITVDHHTTEPIISQDEPESNTIHNSNSETPNFPSETPLLKENVASAVDDTLSQNITHEQESEILRSPSPQIPIIDDSENHQTTITSSSPTTKSRSASPVIPDDNNKRLDRSSSIEDKEHTKQRTSPIEITNVEEKLLKSPTEDHLVDVNEEQHEDKTLLSPANVTETPLSNNTPDYHSENELTNEALPSEQHSRRSSSDVRESKSPVRSRPTSPSILETPELTSIDLKQNNLSMSHSELVKDETIPEEQQDQASMPLSHIDDNQNRSHSPIEMFEDKSVLHSTENTTTSPTNENNDIVKSPVSEHSVSLPNDGQRKDSSFSPFSVPENLQSTKLSGSPASEKGDIEADFNENIASMPVTKQEHQRSRSPSPTTEKDRQRSRSPSPIMQQEQLSNRSSSPTIEQEKQEDSSISANTEHQEQRSRSPSPTPVQDRERSRSPSPSVKQNKDRSRSPSPAAQQIEQETLFSPHNTEHQEQGGRSSSPTEEHEQSQSPFPITNQNQQRSRSPSPSTEQKGQRSRSPSPTTKQDQQRSRSPSPTIELKQERSRSPSPIIEQTREQSGSPLLATEQRSRSPSPHTQGNERRSRSPSPTIEHEPSESQYPSLITNQNQERSRSPSPSSKQKEQRSRSPSPATKQDQQRSRSPSPTIELKQERSRSSSPIIEQTREQSGSPLLATEQRSRSPSPHVPEKERRSRSPSPTIEHEPSESQSPSLITNQNQERSRSPSPSSKQKEQRSRSPSPATKQDQQRSRSPSPTPEQREQNPRSTSPSTDQNEERSHSPSLAVQQIEQETLFSPQNTEHREEESRSSSPTEEHEQSQSPSAITNQNQQRSRSSSPSTEQRGQRSRSSSPSTEQRGQRSRSPSPTIKQDQQRSRSPSPHIQEKERRSRSSSPTIKYEQNQSQSPPPLTDQNQRRSRSPSPSTEQRGQRRRSPSPTIKQDQQRSRSPSPAIELKQERSRSPSPIIEQIHEQSGSPSLTTEQRSRSPSPHVQEKERRSRSPSPTIEHEKNQSQSPPPLTAQNQQRSRSPSPSTEHKGQRSRSPSPTTKQDQQRSRSTSLISEQKQERSRSPSPVTQLEQEKRRSSSFSIEQKQEQNRSSSPSIEQKGERHPSLIEQNQQRSRSPSPVVELKQERTRSPSPVSEHDQQRRRSSSSIHENERKDSIPIETLNNIPNSTKNERSFSPTLSNPEIESQLSGKAISSPITADLSEEQLGTLGSPANNSQRRFSSSQTDDKAPISPKLEANKSPQSSTHFDYETTHEPSITEPKQQALSSPNNTNQVLKKDEHHSEETIRNQQISNNNEEEPKKSPISPVTGTTPSKIPESISLMQRSSFDQHQPNPSTDPMTPVDRQSNLTRSQSQTSVARPTTLHFSPNNHDLDGLYTSSQYEDEINEENEYHHNSAPSTVSVEHRRSSLLHDNGIEQQHTPIDPIDISKRLSIVEKSRMEDTDNTDVDSTNPKET